MIDRVRLCRVSGLLLLVLCVRLTHTDPSAAQAPAPQTASLPAASPSPPSAEPAAQTPAAQPTGAALQPPPPIAPAKFARLQRTGTSELSVYDFQSRRPVHGNLLRLTDREVTLLVDGHEETIPLVSVRRIDRRGDSVWNGFAIGAAVGVFTWIQLYREGAPADGLAWAIGFPALLGAGIDALAVGETTVYRASSSTRAGTRSGTPGRGPSRPRVLFTFRF